MKKRTDSAIGNVQAHSLAERDTARINTIFERLRSGSNFLNELRQHTTLTQKPQRATQKSRLPMYKETNQ